MVQSDQSRDPDEPSDDQEEVSSQTKRSRVEDPALLEDHAEDEQ